jgi:hypothetical protein
MSPEDGDTPITPNIGRAGNDTRSFMVTTPSATVKIRVVGEWTSSMSCPHPGMHIAAPFSPGRMSSRVTDNVSPGSAPRTAIGPVALLTRLRSIFSRVSLSLCTCPVKQSHVSISSTVPGSTVTTGSRFASNDQTCSSRPIFSIASLTISPPRHSRVKHSARLDTSPLSEGPRKDSSLDHLAIAVFSPCGNPVFLRWPRGTSTIASPP